jgi:hypothetical protein
VVFLLVETEILGLKTKVGNSLTCPLNESLSVRLYRDNKPHCLETAVLQKGLVLVYEGEELIEEGIGFGVPVIKYEDKTFFSSNAQIVVNPETGSFEKHYLLDTNSTKRFYKTHVDDNFYQVIHKLFEKAYLGHQTMQPVNNKIMELREILKIKTEFRQVQSRGVVKVKYALKCNAVEVSVDFSGIDLEGCLEFLVLNEQGANTFGCYTDTDGLRLNGARMGAWDLVSAKGATLTNPDGSLAFSLEHKSSAKLFRGWEKTRNRFSWAGLSYSLQPSRSRFDYVISVKC